MSGSATTAFATATFALAESVAMTLVLGLCCSCITNQHHYADTDGTGNMGSSSDGIAQYPDADNALMALQR